MRKLPTLTSSLALVLAASLVGACSESGSPDSDTGRGQPSGLSDVETVGQPSNTSTAPAGTPTTVAPTPTTSTSTTPTTGSATSTGSADHCPDQRQWTTSGKEASPMSLDELYLVRAGRHSCYDRVVFDVNGIVDGPETVGYRVSYVSGDVGADGSGEPVPTNGDATLQVVIRAPIYGASGHQPWRQPPQLHDDLVPPDQIREWDTFRQVVYAGSFEGLTTIAVGLTEELPFRVGTVERDGGTHVYVDVARP